MQTAKKLYIEEVGTLFEVFLLPRMAGKILGWLLVCVPQYQTANELINAVGGSKGSISSMTRLLMQIGLIERVGRPGIRGAYYQIKANSWAELLRNRLGFMKAMRELADRGLALMQDETKEQRQRLQEIHDLYAYLENQMPMIFERWKSRPQTTKLN